MQYLTYMIGKGEVDDIEMKWQENRRKSMKGK